MKRVSVVTGLLWLLACTAPGMAQRDSGAPIGPCSPYAAADGDIASEMPGCARRLRPAPGSLADELEFRRSRRRGEDGPDAAGLDDDPPPSYHRRQRARRPRDP